MIIGAEGFGKTSLIKTLMRRCVTHELNPPAENKSFEVWTYSMILSDVNLVMIDIPGMIAPYVFTHIIQD